MIPVWARRDSGDGHRWVEGTILRRVGVGVDEGLERERLNLCVCLDGGENAGGVENPVQSTEHELRVEDISLRGKIAGGFCGHITLHEPWLAAVDRGTGCGARGRIDS